MNEEATITVTLSKLDWQIIHAALLYFADESVPLEEEDTAAGYHSLKARLAALAAEAWPR